MEIRDKIRLAETYARVPEAELARRIGKSPQSLGQRIRTGKFTSSELDEMADALGAKFVCYFEFPDGERI